MNIPLSCCSIKYGLHQRFKSRSEDRASIGPEYFSNPWSWFTSGCIGKGEGKWFQTPYISVLTALSVIGIALFIWRELTAEHRL